MEEKQETLSEMRSFSFVNGYPGLQISRNSRTCTNCNPNPNFVYWNRCYLATPGATFRDSIFEVANEKHQSAPNSEYDRHLSGDLDGGFFPAEQEKLAKQ